MWKCKKCETLNDGNYCIVCGSDKPAEPDRQESGEQKYNNTVKHKSKSALLKILISMGVLIVFAVISIIGVYFYSKNLMEQKKYSQAKNLMSYISVFVNDNDIYECDYQIAMELYNENEISSAIEILKKIPDYKDSSALVNKCLYTNVINEYIGAYEMYYASDKSDPNCYENILNQFPYVSELYILDASEPMYYLKDIDGDGLDELFIGKENIYSDNYANQLIYGIFTCKNGEVTDLFDKQIGYRYQAFLLDDNTFWTEGSYNSQSFYASSYVLSNTVCDETDKLETEDNVHWYYNNGAVDEEQAQKIISQKREKIIEFDWNSVYDF